MADPGFPVGGGGGVDLVVGAVEPRGGYVSKNLHVKMKESGPVGGVCTGCAPPRSANAVVLLHNNLLDKSIKTLYMKKPQFCTPPAKDHPSHI